MAEIHYRILNLSGGPIGSARAPWWTEDQGYGEHLSLAISGDLSDEGAGGEVDKEVDREVNRVVDGEGDEEVYGKADDEADDEVNDEVNGEMDGEGRNFIQPYRLNGFSRLFSDIYPCIRRRDMESYGKMLYSVMQFIRKEHIDMLSFQSMEDYLFFMRIKRHVNRPFMVALSSDEIGLLGEIGGNAGVRDTQDGRRPEVVISPDQIGLVDMFLVRNPADREALMSRGYPKDRIVVHDAGNMEALYYTLKRKLSGNFA